MKSTTFPSLVPTDNVNVVFTCKLHTLLGSSHAYIYCKHKRHRSATKFTYRTAGIEPWLLANVYVLPED